MINLRKINLSFKPFFILFLILLLFFTFPFPNSISLAGLTEDLVARESWRKISMDFEGASLINVLKIFSQQSGLNFIAAQNVADRTITLYLENVPLRDALGKILKSYNLVYELDEESNIFVVKELIKAQEVETVTRVYALKYALVNSSPLNTASGTSTAGSSLVDTVQKLLSSYGKLNEDSRTNSLIITDLEAQFSLIEETIRKLDVPIPQVVIEAEIIDTTKKLVDSLGVEWTGTLYTLTLGSRTNLAFPFQGWAHTETATTGGSITATNPTAALKLLITDTNTKVLARPRILTLSNQAAEIKITSDKAVGTITVVETEGGTSTTSAERQEVGVTLKVTPSVNKTTGEITMVLEPTISSAEASSISGNFFDPQERSAKVTVALQNGETVVIGGLLRKEFSDTRKHIPVLGDIPFVGALFRSKAVSDEDRELLVFITPRIVDSGSVNLAKAEQPLGYDKDMLVQREQADYQYRKEEVDKALSMWDSK